MKRVTFLILVVYITQNIFAQEYFPARNFTIAQGLSSNKINDIIYDKKGFIWIATENGLNRFDGYRFHVFSYSPFDTNTLANNRILDLEIDYQNKLWIQHADGIQIIDLNSNRFISLKKASPVKRYFDDEILLKTTPDKRLIWHISNKTINIYSTDSLKQLCVYHRLPNDEFNENTVSVFGDSLMFCAEEGIFVKYKKGESGKLDREIIKSQRLGSVYFLEAIDNNQILLVTDNGLFIYHIQKRAILSVYGEKLNFLKNDQHLFAFNNFKVYLLGKDTLCEYDFLNNAIRHLDLRRLNFTSSGNIRQIIADDTGLLWLSTSRGAYCLNPRVTGFKHYLSKEIIGAEGGNITSIEYDNENCWLASGSTIFLYDLHQQELLYETDVSKLIPGKNDVKVNQIKKIHFDEILVATNAGLLNLRKMKETAAFEYKAEVILDNINVESLTIDRKNRLWLVSDGKLMFYNESIHDVKSYSYITSYRDTLYLNNIKYIQAVENSLWLTTDRGLVQFNYEYGNYRIYYPNNDSTFNFPGFMVTSLEIDQYNQPWIATSYGFAYVDRKNNTLKLLNTGKNKYYNISSMKIVQDVIWFSSDKGLSRLEAYLTPEQNVVDYTALTGNLNYNESSSAVSYGRNLVFTAKQGLLTFNSDRVIFTGYNRKPNISMVKLVDDKNREKLFYFNLDYFVLPKSIKYCEIEFSAVDYYSPGKYLYKFRLQRGNKEGSWETLNKNSLVLSGLKPGRYKLEIAIADNSLQPKPTDYVHIFVESAFYESKFAFVVYGIVIILIGYLFVQYRTRRLYRINKAYKEKEVISEQIAIQKEQLSIKNKSITDSINYAKRIQIAMMPSVKRFHSIFPDGFILHLPKDIVSGDFYWVSEVDNKAFMAAVDCTGHGVPGAFMSIIGFELFRRITDEKRIRQPAEILNNLSKGFEDIFADVENMTLRDGMDLALCSIDKNNSLLEFSGAFNPLYLVRENTITEIKGDRFSVGLDTNEEKELTFKNHVIPVKKGDIIYIFTDGFADQFGGPEGKKYKYRRFRHLLLAVHQLPMDKQQQFLQKSILEWKGDHDQVDDILVIGVKIDFGIKKTK